MRLALVIAIALSAVACPDSGPPLMPIGYECRNGSECERGLNCLAYAVRQAAFDGGPATCEQTTIKTCTVTCALDSDCTTWGVNFACLPLCDNSSSYCGRTH